MKCNAPKSSGSARSTPLFLGLVLCLLGTARPSAAQDDPEMVLFAEPMVTAAAKHPQSLASAPAAVTIVTAEEIRRFGYRTLAEVLRAQRGFYGTYDRNYSYVGLRGFLRQSDYNNRILLLVNGHTYNEDVYGMAYLGNEFGIDLEAVKQIEIVRGPGSALYGGNAVFAVVNVVTVEALDRPGVHAVAETGSYERKRGQVSVGHVFEGGAEVFSSASVLDLHGHGQLYYPEFDAPETNFGIAKDLDDEQAINFFLAARYGDFTLQSGVNRRDKHIPTAPFETTFNDPGTHTTDGRQFADLAYTREIGADLLFSLRGFYDGLHYDGEYAYGAGAERAVYGDLGTSHWLGTEARARWQMLPANALTAGIEYTYHPAVTMRSFDVATGEASLDVERSFGTFGVYLQDEWSLLPSVTLVGGVRFDRYYDRLGETSPRAALLWSPLAGTHVKLLYGRAFRPPTIYEQYYGTTASDSSFSYLVNPSLGPERITTYEAVVEQELWRRAPLIASLYYNEINGLIELVEVSTPSSEQTRVQFQNVHGARATGAEIELHVPLPRGVEAGAAYSVQHAEAAGGQRLTNSPEHLGRVGVLFPLPFHLRGGAEMQVVSSRQTPAGATLGTYALVNLALEYETPLPGMRAAFGLYNLLDQRFADPGGDEHVQDRIPQDGITFRLRLEYAF